MVRHRYFNGFHPFTFAVSISVYNSTGALCPRGRSRTSPGSSAPSQTAVSPACTHCFQNVSCRSSTYRSMPATHSTCTMLPAEVVVPQAAASQGHTVRSCKTSSPGMGRNCEPNHARVFYYRLTGKAARSFPPPPCLRGASFTARRYAPNCLVVFGNRY
jgi:hypothetical protein